MTRWRETLRPMLEAAYEGASLEIWWDLLDRRGLDVVNQVLQMPSVDGRVLVARNCCGEGEGGSVCCLESDVVQRSDSQGRFKVVVVRLCKKASGMVGEEGPARCALGLDEVL
jgi:hypothetical protein